MSFNVLRYRICLALTLGGRTTHRDKTVGLPCVTGGWPVDVMCWSFVLVQTHYGLLKEVFMHLCVDLCMNAVHV